jgi:HD-GYP domain-containing protein (c-di-GMP phosphodiesterase class II)
MRKISIKIARPGEKLARDIITDNGNVLLRAGRELNNIILERLSKLSIDSIYIEDKLTEDIRPSESLNEDTRVQALTTVRHTMLRAASNPSIESLAAAPQLGAIFRDVYKRLLEAMTAHEPMLVNLADLHVSNDYLFNQSINVATLSILMGLSKGYNERQLEELGIGALLVDIGMLRLPKSLWNTDSPLTEEDRKIIRTHPEVGFQFLRKQEGISLISALCAQQHHERYDGEGYPNQLKGDEIHEYAQIIAIADVYSALTSTRTHRQRYTPAEAIEYLYAMGNSHFSMRMLQLFISQVAIYPVASTVLLNTGQTAVVYEVKPSLVTRPIIRIISEADGTPVSVQHNLDLSLHHNVTIVNTV